MASQESASQGVGERLDAALAVWKEDLQRVTRIEGEDAPRLTMNQPHPGGLAQLYTDHPTRLSLLIREPASHLRAVERVRTIMARSRELTARHGLGHIHMSIGQTRWFEGGRVCTSAALLRHARLTENGGDVTITLLPGYELDPVLGAALEARGVVIDIDGLIANATSPHGFSSSHAMSQLRSAGSVLDRFELRDELILGIFEHPASRLQREFDHADHILASPIVRALAGDDEARASVRAPLPAPDPTDRDPWKERGAGDLTPRQLDVVEAVAQGASFLVDVPHGADGTALVGAILADAGASGRSTLHITGSPSRTTRAEDRLRELGIGEMATRIDATTASGEELRARLRDAMADTSQVADLTEVDALRTQLRDVREKLSSYTSHLHRPFRAFGVSAFNALQVLTDLTGAHPSPATHVRLREDVLLAIAQDQGAHARALLHEASSLGIFSRATAHTAWKGVVINSEEQVSEVLQKVTRLSDELLPELRVRMGVIAAEADIEPATTLNEWYDQLSMFEGVRDVLDMFQPQIFERSAADMVIATASKQWRAAHGITMKRSERVRLVKQAEDLVRPGVYVDDLHRRLLLVQEHREAWRSQCNADGWPTLPQRLDDARELTKRISDDLASLEPQFSTAHKNFTEMSVVDVAELFDALAHDPEGARELPRRVSVLKKLGEIGLAPLANDLRERFVSEGLIDAELDLAWWASVLGIMLAAEPELGGFDPARLEEMLASGRALDAEQVLTLAPQAIGQLRRLRLQAMATRPDQVNTLERVIKHGGGAVEVFNSVPLARHLIPIVFTVPTLVPLIVGPGHHVDLLVLDSVDELPLAELIPIIARANQVVVLADMSTIDEDGASAALASILESVRMDVTPTRLNDQVALLMARYGVDHTGVPVPWTSAAAPVTALWCEGTGMPAPGARAVESTLAEVDAVVNEVVAHAVEQPELSLGVIALNERHAERIRQAIARIRASEPGLAAFFDQGSAEPFGVVGPGETRGFERDHIIISVGFAKTPHGRVIHDFGEFSRPQGSAIMADALRAVRGDLTIVSSLRASDIDRSRLTMQACHMLLDLLEIAEGQSGEGAGAWPILEAEPDRLLVDLADRLYGMGLEVVANVGIPGGMRIPLAIGHPEAPGRLLVAVLTDDDAYVAEPSLRVRDRMWPMMLEAQGWKVHTALSMAVFIDPAKEADTIVQLVLDAVDEINGSAEDAVVVPERVEIEPEPEVIVEESARLDELVAQTSEARERVDELETGVLNVVVETQPSPARGERPMIATGLPLAAYSDDQLDEMAMWVRSDGVERTHEQLVEELRESLGITRRGFQSDAVLGNVVKRTESSSDDGTGGGSAKQDFPVGDDER